MQPLALGAQRELDSKSVLHALKNCWASTVMNSIFGSDVSQSGNSPPPSATALQILRGGRITSVGNIYDTAEPFFQSGGTIQSVGDLLRANCRMRVSTGAGAVER